MTATDTAKAIALIDAELRASGVPEALSETLSPSILGALTDRFMLIPHPTVEEDAQTRLDLAALDIPGFHDFVRPKGRA